MHAVCPHGLTAVSVLFGAAAVLSLTFAVLTAFFDVPLMSGYFLVGDFAFSGPVAFVVYAIINAACAVGLCMMNRWARWAAIILLVYSLVQIVPAISSAVMDDRFRSAVWWAASILFRAVALWYLLQPPVRERFRKSA